jgi:hypothetical protein
MANAIYPKFKEALLTNASANISMDQNTTTDGPYVALVNTTIYTYSSTDRFLSNASTALLGTDQRLSTPTVASGTFDADDVTYTAVSGGTASALLIYRKNNQANTAWRAVAYIDTSVTGLPVVTNGGNITITWNASGIFTL